MVLMIYHLASLLVSVCRHVYYSRGCVGFTPPSLPLYHTLPRSELFQLVHYLITELSESKNTGHVTGGQIEVEPGVWH